MRKMKIVAKIFLIASFIILASLITKLVDAYISFKYEVEEPLAMGKDSGNILAVKQHIQSLINWIWIMIMYTFISISVSVVVLMAKSNRQK